MKFLAIFLIGSISLFCIAASAQKTPERITSTAGFLPLKNGKYQYVSCNYDKDAGKPVFYSDKSLLTSLSDRNKTSLCQNPKQTYHIVFHYNVPAKGCVCIGTSTIYSEMDMTWSSDFTTASIDMEEGYYDILVDFSGLNIKNVFTEGFHVYKDMDTTISSTSANHLLSLATYDENNILIPKSYSPGNQFGIVYELPDTFKVKTICGFNLGWYTDSVFLSTISPSVKIYTGISRIKKNEPAFNQYQRFLSSFQALQGIDTDVALMTGPSDYTEFPLTFNLSSLAFPEYYSFNYGLLWNELLGEGGYISFGLLCNHDPCDRTDTIRVFANKMSNDTNCISFSAGIAKWEEPPGAFPDRSINSWMMYTTDENELMLSNYGHYPPVASDYKVEAGSRVSFGNNVPFGLTFGLNIPDVPQISSYIEYRGQANERRQIDNLKATYDIWKGDQHLYHGLLNFLSFIYSVPDPQEYTVILNDSSFAVMGRPGYQRIQMDMDLRKADPNPPSLTSFRILNGDKISSELIHNSPASVSMTAADFYYESMPGLFICHQLAGVKAFYRNSLDTGWVVLSPVSYPSSFDSVGGMKYTVDLQPALDANPGNAWIDLKIVLTDSTGNVTTQSFFPAFHVRDAGVWISPVEKNEEARIYPNPAQDKLYIFPAGKVFAMEVFSADGRMVMQRSVSDGLDISGLDPGIYFIRLRSTDEGIVSCKRFVKI